MGTAALKNRIGGWLARARGRGAGSGGVTAGRSRRLDALHVFALCSFGIAEPAYNRVGERASFLIDSGITIPAVLVWIALVSLVLPALIVLVERLAALWGPRTYEAAHATIVFVLLTLASMSAWTRLTPLQGDLSMALALATAVAGVLLYFRWERMRSIVSVMAIGVVLFPLALVFHSSITGIAFPRDEVRIDERPRTPVVLLILDEVCGSSLMTPDREIDRSRFPNFARLAERATWYRNATTVHDDTWQAVPAILSGRRQTKLWSPTPADLPLNLFSLLSKGAGYDFVAFEPVSTLSEGRRSGVREPDLREQLETLSGAASRAYLLHLLPIDFHRQLPRLPPLWFGMRDSSQVDGEQRRGVIRYGWSDNRTRQFDHFLETIDDSPAPTLYFMHAVLPHVPWIYLPSGRRYVPDIDLWNLMTFTGHDYMAEYWGQDDLLVAHSEQRYLLQLGYVDRLIGRLVQRLEEVGLYDECLLVVTGDHGVSFRSGKPRRAAVPANLADILSIPLFVKRPHQQAGSTSDRPVETIDILPTIVEELGIHLRVPLEGWSMFDTSHPDRTEKTVYHRDLGTTLAASEIVNSDVPARIREQFGDSSDPASLFRIGPESDLIGRRVDSLEVLPAPRVTIAQFRRGSPPEGEPLVESFFQGIVLSPAPVERPVTIAVAVNGVILATTRTYLLEGIRDRWAAMVPDWQVSASGTDEVRFYSVDGTGSDRRLAPCLEMPPLEESPSPPTNEVSLDD